MKSLLTIIETKEEAEKGNILSSDKEISTTVVTQNTISIKYNNKVLLRPSIIETGRNMLQINSLISLEGDERLLIPKMEPVTVETKKM